MVCTGSGKQGIAGTPTSRSSSSRIINHWWYHSLDISLRHTAMGDVLYFDAAAASVPGLYNA
jgi:hypothetical protein